MDASAFPGSEEPHPPDNNTNAAKRARKRVIHTASLRPYFYNTFHLLTRPTVLTLSPS